MICELLILRHGEANLEGTTDHERSLTQKGIAQAKMAGQRLREWLTALDTSSSNREVLIIVSDAHRTQETWAQVRDCLDDDEVRGWTVRHTRELYLASVDYLYSLTLDVFMEPYSAQSFSPPLSNEVSNSARVLVLIGHNPGLSDLIHSLSGEWLSLQTGEYQRLQALDSSLTTW